MSATGTRDPFRDYITPNGDIGPECTHWCAPLHMVTKALDGADFARHFNPNDFMVMAALKRRGKPLLYLYKHSYTRRYLNVDAAGGVWKYCAPKDLTSDSRGRYVRLRDLRTAIMRLELWLLPRMDPRRFGGPELADWGNGDDWDDVPWAAADTYDWSTWDDVQ